MDWYFEILYCCGLRRKKFMSLQRKDINFKIKL